MMHNAVLRISFCGIWFSCVMAISHMNNLNACFHKNASPSSTELIVMFNLRNVFFCFSIFSMYHLRFWIHTGWSMFWGKVLLKPFSRKCTNLENWTEHILIWCRKCKNLENWTPTDLGEAPFLLSWFHDLIVNSSLYSEYSERILFLGTLTDYQNT